jgi:hypothetical protein
MVMGKDQLFSVSSASRSRSLFPPGLSSKRILTAGAISSSYWPLFTLQIKANRNREATEILAISSKMMTLMGKELTVVKIKGTHTPEHDIHQYGI